MNIETKLRKKLIFYFSSFSKKDLKKLENIFSDDIMLVDWTTSLKNKNNVLKFNKELFKKFRKIKVTLSEIFFNLRNKSFACKIIISLDNKKIDVVDLIYFNSKLQIKKIIAYLK